MGAAGEAVWLPTVGRHPLGRRRADAALRHRLAELAEAAARPAPRGGRAVRLRAPAAGAAGAAGGTRARRVPGKLRGSPPVGDLVRRSAISHALRTRFA